MLKTKPDPTTETAIKAIERELTERIDQYAELKKHGDPAHGYLCLQHAISVLKSINPPKIQKTKTEIGEELRLFCGKIQRTATADNKYQASRETKALKSITQEYFK